MIAWGGLLLLLLWGGGEIFGLFVYQINIVPVLVFAYFTIVL